MGQATVMTAQISCVAGAAPVPLVANNAPTVQIGNMVAATIMDNVPFKNIPTFGNCKILTAAASGVPTPCVPATVAPWAPGSPTVLIGNFPALNNSSKLMCTIGGVISIVSPGQVTVQVP